MRRFAWPSAKHSALAGYLVRKYSDEPRVASASCVPGRPLSRVLRRTTRASAVELEQLIVVELAHGAAVCGLHFVRVMALLVE